MEGVKENSGGGAGVGGSKQQHQHACIYCTFKASCYFALKRHVGYHEKGLQLYQCPSCEYTTFNVIKFRSHKIVHFEETKFKCSMCAYITITQKLLKRHIQKQHKVKQEAAANAIQHPVPATLPHSAPTEGGMYHMAGSVVVKTEEFGDDKGPPCEIMPAYLVGAPAHTVAKYECKLCSYTTSCKVELRRHNRSVHQSFLCDICGICYSRFSSLKKHRSVKHPTSNNNSPGTSFLSPSEVNDAAHSTVMMQSSSSSSIPLTTIKQEEFNDFLQISALPKSFAECSNYFNHSNSASDSINASSAHDSFVNNSLIK